MKNKGIHKSIRFPFLAWLFIAVLFQAACALPNLATLTTSIPLPSIDMDVPVSIIGETGTSTLKTSSDSKTSFLSAQLQTGASCDAYDALTGTKVNTQPGNLVTENSSTVCRLKLDSGKISSSNSALIIEITGANGAKFSILEKDAVASIIAGKLKVTSTIPVNNKSVIAYYQSLAGAGADCLSSTGTKIIASDCLASMHVNDIYITIQTINSSDSNAGTAITTMASMLDGFFLGGGASDGAITDSIDFIKRCQQDDATLLAEAAIFSKTRTGTAINADDFDLIHETGRFQGSIFDDETITSGFETNSSFKDQIFKFINDIETPADLIAVNGAGDTVIKDFFNPNNFTTSVDPTAVKELFEIEAAKEYKNILDADKRDAYIEILIAEDFETKTLAELEAELAFYSGFIDRLSNDQVDDTLTREQIENLVDVVDGISDFDTVDDTYYDNLYGTIENQVAEGDQDWADDYSSSDFINPINLSFYSRSPSSTQTNVYHLADIHFTLNKRADLNTINANTFSMNCASIDVAGVITANLDTNLDRTYATFNPNTSLPFSSTCIVTVKGIKSITGELLTDSVWRFFVGPNSFNAIHTSKEPLSGSNNQDVDSPVSITFNYPVDNSTLNSSNFYISGCGSFTCTRSLTDNSKTINCDPDDFANPNSVCTVTVKGGLKDIYGRSLGSDVVWTYGTKSPLGTPASLILNGKTDQVDLNWNAVTGANEYRIYRKPASGGIGTSDYLNSVYGATTYSDVSTTNGTVYYYAVMASAVGEDSNPFSTEFLTTPLAKPTNLAGSPSGNQVNLTWNTVTGAGDYIVYYDSTPNITIADSNVSSGGSSFRNMTGLTDGQKYYFRVEARYASNSKSQLSAEIMRLPASSPPASPPGNISAVPTNGKVKIQFDAVSDADNYKIYYHTASNVDSSSNYTGSVLTNGLNHFDVPGLTNGTTYYFVVLSKNVAGFSADSGFVSATPQL